MLTTTLSSPAAQMQFVMLTLALARITAERTWDMIPMIRDKIQDLNQKPTSEPRGEYSQYSCLLRDVEHKMSIMQELLEAREIGERIDGGRTEILEIFKEEDYIAFHTGIYGRPDVHIILFNEKGEPRVFKSYSAPFTEEIFFLKDEKLVGVFKYNLRQYMRYFIGEDGKINYHESYDIPESKIRYKNDGLEINTTDRGWVSQSKLLKEVENSVAKTHDETKVCSEDRKWTDEMKSREKQQISEKVKGKCREYKDNQQHKGR